MLKNTYEGPERRKYARLQLRDPGSRADLPLPEVRELPRDSVLDPAFQETLDVQMMESRVRELKYQASNMVNRYGREHPTLKLVKKELTKLTVFLSGETR